MTPTRTRLLVSGALAAALLAPASAGAFERPPYDVSVQSSWPQPDLPLQAEGPRLFLDLPPEWLPLSESGGLGPLDFAGGLVFLRASRRSFDLSASFSGTTLHLDLQHRSFEFGLVVKSQAAVMVLRFDPIPARFR
ncbi:MAG: hypothetical protein R6X02_02610 [Enhygromyxa sp.]